MEFSVSDALLVELTAMALDAYERCLLTGLLDGTMKMWNHNTGECLLTFPNPDQVEVSLLCQLDPEANHGSWDPKTCYCWVFLKGCMTWAGVLGFKPAKDLVSLSQKMKAGNSVIKFNGRDPLN